MTWWPRHRRGRASRFMLTPVVVPSGSVILASGHDEGTRCTWCVSEPLCSATKKNYPGKGAPCQLKAMHGSVFCVAHDPGREAGWREHLEHARTLAA